MSLRSLTVSASLLVTLLLSVPLVAGFFGAWHPAFDSFAHFRVHLAVLMGLAALPVLFSAWWGHGLVALLLAAGAVASALGVPALGIGPVHAGFQTRINGAPSYTLMHLNLLYNNDQPEKALALVRDRRPDILLLSEASDMWAQRLKDMLADYPYQLRCGRGTRLGGAAILSRLPFSPDRRTQCSDNGRLAIAGVELGDRAMDVAALHVGWPWPADQADEIARLSPLLSSLGTTAILAGDLNATPWSNAARRVAAAGDLTLIRSPGPTWLFRWLPASLRPLVGLPIDHVYAKGDVVLHSGETLEEVGSDHLPILIEFSLPAVDPPSDDEIAVAALPSLEGSKDIRPGRY
ncbi:endonuclease/exonuclease/phosphatase family protein [Arvimicrobium flavum]|uniref:endonuclease/exonuclease/phosphatase family protein n=1 Tax=Arvimicrobium flavum TaxID=3393320 RepID=UPI00237B93F4|nr:endonuclease/exonuclease/phosphatase family protein [Mesorhizobium shangrilense]